PAGDAESVKKCRQHLQHFGIAGGGFASGTRRANRFRADLVELAVAAFLGALAAELRCGVEEFVETALPELMLDVGADDASSIFGTEGEGLGRLEIVHLDRFYIHPFCFCSITN